MPQIGLASSGHESVTGAMRRSRSLPGLYKASVHDAFVLAVELAERMHEITMEGQNSGSSIAKLREGTRELTSLSADFGAVVASINVALHRRFK